METKKSKIKNLEMLPEWSNSNGTYYPHKVTFENGETAIANKKKQNAYQIGRELEYQIVGEDKVGNKKFKEIQQNNFNNSYKSKSVSNASFALSYAKDIMCKFVETHNVTDDKADAIADRAISIATKFNNWLNENA